MIAIFQFENHEHVAVRFKTTRLEPKLRRANLFAQTHFEFRHYVNHTLPSAPIVNPNDVALSACKAWEKLTPAPEKTVWIIDLDATGATTPDSSYGLCVLLSLATLHGVTVEEFLRSGSFLTVILTNYSSDLFKEGGLSVLPKRWCDLASLENVWRRIQLVQKAPRNTETVTKLSDIVTTVPKMLVANLILDEEWLSQEIMEWIL